MPNLTYTSFMERVETDADYRASFIADPKPVLAKMGIVYPEHATVHIIEDDQTHINLVVGNRELYTDEHLATMPHEIRAVLKRSFADPDFRALLLSRPVDAIFLEIGYRVPDTCVVTTFEATDSDIYFPIVRTGEGLDEEQLSEVELEQVAGGRPNLAASVLRMNPLLANARDADPPDAISDRYPVRPTS